MGDRIYQFLKYTAIAMVVGFVAFSIYDEFYRGRDSSQRTMAAATRSFEDGRYELALADYEKILEEKPADPYALHGRAMALMQLDRREEAMEAFAAAIEAKPDLGVNYANRGILYDRMGFYRKALADYERALELDEGIEEGPGFLTRFLRNQAEKPPTVADRAQYLREQLALPESERLLKVPELDQEQRPYKYD